MSSLNPRKVSDAPKTHEGGRTVRKLSPSQQLRRAVFAYLMFDQFYEEGQSIVDRIWDLAKQVSDNELLSIIDEARNEHNLRTVSVLLAVIMAKTRSGEVVRKAINVAIKRADEISDFLSAYTNGQKVKFPNQVKKGLKDVFKTFSPYHLARNQAKDKAWSLKDAIVMLHPKPIDTAQEQCFKAILDGKLAFPESWQTELSAGKDKKEVFTRLISESKLGALDTLRNLRNMNDAGVDYKLMVTAINKINPKGILPFRYVAAARNAPNMIQYLDAKMLESIAAMPKLSGLTAVLVDVSGSMRAKLSAKSDLTRMDAACALAVIVNSDMTRVFSFSNRVKEIVPVVKGLNGVDTIAKSQPNGGTELSEAVNFINKTVDYDRLIVITDEQSSSNSLPATKAGKRGYMINVASYKNGVGYNQWVHIDGFSEAVIKYIHSLETI